MKPSTQMYGCRICELHFCEPCSTPEGTADVNFFEVLYALSDNLCGTELPVDARVTHEMRAKLKKKRPRFDMSAELLGVHEYIAIRKVQEMWRLASARRKVSRIGLIRQEKDESDT